MHIDARKMEDGSLIEGDICIIGAGAAGISMALEFIGTPHKVILLEGGGFEYEDRMQDLYAGQATGQRYFPLRSIRLHYFGGTTGHWAGFCAPFDEIDFEKRDWIPLSGWPIKKKDLDPYYERAHPILELGPYNYDPEFWMRKDPTMVPLPFSRDRVRNKIWQFSPPTRFGKKFRDAIVNAPNVHLYTYANVTDIGANPNVDHIEQLTVKNFAGRRHTVKAKRFVLATCAVQNARLLLVSNGQNPKGLGNSNDLVGRHFMEHLEMKAGELWFDKPDRLKMYMWGYNYTKARAELAVSPELQRLHKTLNGTSSLSPLEDAREMKPFMDQWEDEKGDGMAKRMRTDPEGKAAASPEPEFKSTNAFQLFMRVEQAPNPDSRITLDNERDELGVPRSRLHWTFTELEKRSIRKIHEIIGTEAGLSGAARVRLLDYLRDEKDTGWPEFTGGGWHHMGTTRMGDDPKTSVVDADCKVHGIDNLFVAGSSCFTTAGAPNPTLTLVALSLRLADHLKAKSR